MQTRPCDYLFVIGSPRSGTTLLRLVLSAHPRISISPETHSLQQVMCQFPHGRVLQDPELERLKQIILRDRKLASWKIDLESYWQKVQGYTAITARQAAEDMMLYYRDQTAPEAHIVGNKKGSLLEHGEVVRHLFPEARFIFIVRDARDAVLSMKTNLEGYNLWSASLTWCRRVAYSWQLQDKYPGQFLGIKYEDLVSEPEPVCRRICNFLEIEYSEKMLYFYKSNEQLQHVLEGKEAIHRNTANPLTKSRIGAWRGRLSEDEVRIVEIMGGAELKRLGYPLNLPWALKPWTRLQCQYSRIRDHLRWQRELRDTQRRTSY